MEHIRILTEQLFPIEKTFIAADLSGAAGGRGIVYKSENGNEVMLCLTESIRDPLDNQMYKDAAINLNSRPYLVKTWKSIPKDIVHQVLRCKTDFIEKKNISYHFEDGFQDKEIIIVIPLMGRKNNIKTVLQSFTKDSSIGILVVEGDKTSTDIRDISIKEGCSYLHIEVDDFNKSQCMNIAYSVAYSKTNADWFVFHDADVVLCSEFNEQVKNRIKQDDLPRFFQCFNKKCVRYLEKNQSESLRELVSSGETLTEKNYKTFVENSRSLGLINVEPSPGAPGGSICIHRDLFESIGGYDPEWCLRYGPEDSMFLIKANYFYDKVCYDKKHGTCGVHRIETENLDCLGCHLWHPTATFGDVFLFSAADLIQNVLTGMDKRSIQLMLQFSSDQLERTKIKYLTETAKIL